MNIKTEFWKTYNQEKTIKLIWIFLIITQINTAYAYSYESIMMLIINGLTTLMSGIMIISYNRWKKNGE